MIIQSKQIKKRQLKSVSQLKKLADKTFSVYIRRRDNGRCFTCHNQKEWKYQQCGHYVSRSHNSLRYSEVNCHCQCLACNCFRAGNMDEYALKLKEKYGDGILEKLNKLKHTTKKFTPIELQMLIKKYRQKIKEL